MRTRAAAWCAARVIRRRGLGASEPGLAGPSGEAHHIGQTDNRRTSERAHQFKLGQRGKQRAIAQAMRGQGLLESLDRTDMGLLRYA